MSSAVFGAPRLLIHFPDPNVTQGSIVKVQLSMDADSFQQIDIQKMKGQTLAETVYLYNVSSFIRRSGESWFDAEALIVFVKIPENKNLLHKSAQSEILLNLSDVSVKPTEAPQSFIFGDFTAPEKKKYLLWLVSFVLLLLLGVFGFTINKKIKLKKERKKIRSSLKSELLSVNSYEDAVKVWQKKQDFLKEFPSVEKSFLDFQGVLFKYVFKQKQTDLEKQEVLNSYKAVSQSVQELKDGV